MKKENNFTQYEKALIDLTKNELALQKLQDSFATSKAKKYKTAMKFMQKDKVKYNRLATKYNELQINEAKLKLLQEKMSNLLQS
ncbi:hypothetical protein SCLARK_00897 [Spiroplasma clarkii]|uniref:hypothetical protein n=1 Tax=Spiroplasma clarkii TaxID=2139 RepID=UPI000B55D5BD|nr:hypothetical protein [Spiroplasma clarkii]ARU91508.1 hypothetical protein SCLARK_00897 [Spiroplasma clarkii]